MTEASRACAGASPEAKAAEPARVIATFVAVLEKLDRKRAPRKPRKPSAG